MSRVAAVILLALVLGGCGGTNGPPKPDRALPSLTFRCGEGFGDVAKGGRTFWFQADDGTWLDGAAVGTGKVAVVLAHESESNYCHWLEYVRLLRPRGLTAFLFDFRGHGGSTYAKRSAAQDDFASDVGGAVAEARRRGAEKIFVVGASLGGTAALVAGPDLGPSAAGVVSLSGPADLTGVFGGKSDLDALKAAGRLDAPVLLAAATGDGHAVPDARKLYRAASSRDKRIVVAGGPEHGWDLLLNSATVEAAVRDFIRAHS